MSVRFLLDTDHLSLFQRDHAPVVAHVLACPPTQLAITVVTVEEQIQGRLAMIRRATDERDVARGYARLMEALALFQAIQVVQYDHVAAEHFDALRRQKVRIGTHDLRIGAIALAIGAMVVTRNQRDFAQIPQLSLADWSREV